MAQKQDWTIEQGKTFTRVVRWEALPFVYVPIAGITRAAPAVITTSGAHGIPDGWRVAVVSVQGMTEINAASGPLRERDLHKATVVDTTHIELNDVNSSEFTAYESGGYLQFYTPVNLSSYDARMQIKDRVGGTELELLEAPTDITINNTNKTITVTISATATAAYTWKRGVYELEMFSTGSGEVVALLAGTITVTPEVTTAA